jgi:hypothetical protein
MPTTNLTYVNSNDFSGIGGSQGETSTIGGIITGVVHNAAQFVAFGTRFSNPVGGVPSDATINSVTYSVDGAFPVGQVHTVNTYANGTAGDTSFVADYPPALVWFSPGSFLLHTTDITWVNFSSTVTYTNPVVIADITNFTYGVATGSYEEPGFFNDKYIYFAHHSLVVDWTAVAVYVWYYNPSTNHYQYASSDPGAPWTPVVGSMPAPTVTSVSPPSGSVAGGTPVTITGTYFGD